MPCDSRRRTLALACSALAAATLLPLSAQAANAWPSRPVRLVVGFPGGSSPDLTARLLAEPLAKALGKPVVVENRPGAGGNVGAAAVVNANDDHTFGLMINGNLTIARILNPRAPYDPLKDLQPVSLIGVAPLVLVAPVLGLQFGLDGPALGILMLSLLLGTPTLSLIGSIGASLTLGVRGAGVLLSLLILPLYIPVLIFGAGAVEAYASGLGPGGHLSLLAALLVLALFFAPLATTAALKISLE